MNGSLAANSGESLHALDERAETWPNLSAGASLAIFSILQPEAQMTPTKIQWTDETWNPVTGCTKISPGCANCYAERQSNRLQRMQSRRYKNGFAVTLHPEALMQPLMKLRPRKIFVNSMSDLFHEDVPDAFIRQIFAVMSLAGQHTFQILTKRAARMKRFFDDPENSLANCQAEFAVNYDFPKTPTGRSRVRNPNSINGFQRDGRGTGNWPLPNVWLGVSAENQEMANLRLPSLMQTPAVVRWLSAEPLLERLDVEPWIQGRPFTDNYKMTFGGDDFHGLDWLVVGGESGPERRECRPEWVRSLRDQCEESYCSFFLKQWGARGVKELEEIERIINGNRI